MPFPLLSYRTYLSWAISLLLFQTSWAQLPAQSLAKVQARFDTYRKQHLQEKLYAHTDQSTYLTGETVWFRLFCVDGSLHKPLTISKVAYVELLNAEGRAVSRSTVSMGEKGGNGSLPLPLSLPSGTYELRAYTQWMRGASPDFLFQKALTVINPFRKPDLPTPTDTLAWSVQCFPEGGQLVAGLPTTVAVHATDSKTGRGVDYRGVVLTERNDTVARFSTEAFGMSTFRLTPSATGTYRLRLTNSRGRTVVRPLSLPVQAQGYTLQVEPTDNGLRVTVQCNIPAEAEVYLFAHTRQVVGVAERQALRDGRATFTVPLSQLGEGISHLTLFTANGQPVGERLWFRRPGPSLTAQLTTDRTTYAPRQPVALALTTTRPDGTLLPADASVAVYRVDSLSSPASINDPVDLPDYLWLTSDLHGSIENPAFYLTQTGPAADAARNLLMLTHGWRRFRWEAVLQPGSAALAFGPEYRGLTVRGRVLKGQTGQPAANVPTYLSVPGLGSRLYSLRSDGQGYVRYELPELSGPSELVLQPAALDSTYRVELLSPYVETPGQLPLPAVALVPTQRADLTTRSLAVQTQYHFFSPPPPTTGADSSTFYGQPNEHYRLADYTRFQTMEEVLSEYVPGVSVRRQGGGHFALRVNNVPYKMYFTDPPLLLLDGVPVFDTDKFMAVSPLKIRTLDVVTGRYFLGPLSYPGIVSANSYKQDLGGYPLDPRAVVLDYDGIQARREFVAPSYATGVQQASRLPDFRQLLYWNPQVTTGAQGKADLRFYTSDQEGRYRVVVQALTADGRFTTASQTFTVQGVQ